MNLCSLWEPLTRTPLSARQSFI